LLRVSVTVCPLKLMASSIIKQVSIKCVFTLVGLFVFIILLIFLSFRRRVIELEKNTQFI